MSTQSNTDAILDNLLTGVLVVDADLQIHFANTAAKHLLPLSHRRLSGALYLQDDAVALDISLDLARIRHCINTEQSFTDSEVQLTIKGQAHWVEVSVTPLPAAFLTLRSPLSSPHSSPEPDLALVEIHLVEQQKKISQELQQRTQQQVARELVRGLAHEIKNPLAGLRGAAQLLERELASPELAEFTQLIIAQADRLSNLVDRLLGPQQLGTRQPENLHSVLERVRQLVALELPPQIILARDYDPSIPELEMDAEQIEQALLNIVRNAAQALAEDTRQPIDEAPRLILKTRTAYQVLLQGKRYRLAAEIHIIDNGPGILESLRDTLFYPMVSGRQAGTGLGLSLAQDIIQQHGGRIESHSRPGHTEFIIYLPLRQ